LLSTANTANNIASVCILGGYFLIDLGWRWLGRGEVSGDL